SAASTCAPSASPTCPWRGTTTCAASPPRPTRPRGATRSPPRGAQPEARPPRCRVHACLRRRPHPVHLRPRDVQAVRGAGGGHARALRGALPRAQARPRDAGRGARALARHHPGVPFGGEGARVARLARVPAGDAAAPVRVPGHSPVAPGLYGLSVFSRSTMQPEPTNDRTTALTLVRWFGLHRGGLAREISIGGAAKRLTKRPATRR